MKNIIIIVLLTTFFITIKTIFPTNPFREELLYKVRDPGTNRYEFRETIEKLGEYLALEISKNIKTKQISVKTPMNEIAVHEVFDDDIVIVCILRAGVPLFNGMVKVFKDAECGFLAMSRDEETLQPTNHWECIPEIEGKVVIIADVMIATAGSILKAIEIVEKYHPKKIIVGGVFIATKGRKAIMSKYLGMTIIGLQEDPGLSKKGYILPGLGDAGDRAFGIRKD